MVPFSLSRSVIDSHHAADAEPGLDAPAVASESAVPGSRAETYVYRSCTPMLVTMTLGEVVGVLRDHGEWTGVLGFDEFERRIVFRAPPPFARPWALNAAPLVDLDMDRVSRLLEAIGFERRRAMVAGRRVYFYARVPA